MNVAVPRHTTHTHTHHTHHTHTHTHHTYTHTPHTHTPHIHTHTHTTHTDTHTHHTHTTHTTTHTYIYIYNFFQRVSSFYFRPSLSGFCVSLLFLLRFPFFYFISSVCTFFLLSLVFSLCSFVCIFILTNLFIHIFFVPLPLYVSLLLRLAPFLALSKNLTFLSQVGKERQLASIPACRPLTEP